MLAVIIDPGGRMRPTDPRWSEFIARLQGPEGCDLRRTEDGRLTTKCGTDRSETPYCFATAILLQMGLTRDEILASLQFFSDLGGHCDCEIVLNVESSFASALQRLVKSTAAFRRKPSKSAKQLPVLGVN